MHVKWDRPTNMQIIAQIRNDLENNPSFKKLNITWDAAREILNKKPENMLIVLISKLTIIPNEVKPAIKVLAKTKLNQLLTKDEIKTIIPYLYYKPIPLLALIRTIIYSLNQLDDAQTYITTLPLDQKSQDKLLVLLFIIKNPISDFRD